VFTHSGNLIWHGVLGESRAVLTHEKYLIEIDHFKFDRIWQNMQEMNI
jgi:hypothetical protein